MIYFQDDVTLDSVAVAMIQVGDDTIYVYNPALRPDIPMWMRNEISNHLGRMLDTPADEHDAEVIELAQFRAWVEAVRREDPPDMHARTDR